MAVRDLGLQREEQWSGPVHPFCLMHDTMKPACEGSCGGRSAESVGRVVPVSGGANDPHARGKRRGVRGTRGRFRPRPARAVDQDPDRLRAAVSPTGPVGARSGREPRVGGRRILRRDLPRAPLRLAPAGDRRAVA